MGGLNDIWAKSNPVETLETHTGKVLEVWNQLRQRYKDIICDDGFWNYSFYAIAFHDFGKICSNFQETIKGQRAFSDDERVRHEFFSGMFLFSNNHTYYEQNPESLVAVFSHHKPFNDEGFNQHVFRNTVIRHFVERTVVDEFIEFINQKAAQYQIHPVKINNRLKYFILNDYSELVKWYKRKIYDLISKHGDLLPRSREIYIKHKALLNISDWTASGDLLLEEGISFDLNYLKTQIISKLISDKKYEIAEKFLFRKFQLDCIDKSNVIAIAPTGSGKTEAALLWASDKKEWERIIYLLPTRVTSNAIYQRLSSYFGRKKVQLIHSSARLFIKEQVDDEYDQKKYFRDKSFFKNVNVCTIDQILTPGFNLGFWEVKTFHMMNAKVIIDEIHLYAPYTLGLILSTIKYLKDNFNTNFMIMTATMPSRLLMLLEETLGEVDIIRDIDLLDAARNRFEVRESVIDEVTEEIAEQIRQNKKVLVVANTVDKAIELFDLLKPVADKVGVKAICYHSRFINKHRSKKEKDIFEMDSNDEGGVLIATQVVEVSLDIDFDILFTENAPIDAIIQRAGRVNRKRAKQETKVIILRHFEISEKIYAVEEVLENTYSQFVKHNNKRLTESELTAMVDQVYAKINIISNDEYKEGLNKHTDIQFKYDFIKDLTSDDKVFTREGLDTISVIPDKYYKELYQCQDKDKLTNHELSISKRRSNTVQIVPGPLGFKFIGCLYNYKRGLTFKKKQETTVEIY